LKKIVGRSFCNTPWNMTSFIMEYLCSLSGTIGHFLKNIHYYNYTEPKVSKWFYRPCLDIATFYDKAEKLIWTMFFFDCQLKLFSIHQTNICSICKWKHTMILNSPPSWMFGSATWCDPLPNLPWCNRRGGFWMQLLHQHEDLFKTLILQWSKVDASFFVLRPCSQNLTSYARQWPEWKFED